MKHAVNSKPDAQLAPVWGEVDVRGVLLHRLRHDLIDELDDWRVINGLVQVDDLAGLLFLLAETF